MGFEEIDGIELFDIIDFVDSVGYDDSLESTVSRNPKSHATFRINTLHFCPEYAILRPFFRLQLAIYHAGTLPGNVVWTVTRTP